MIATAAKKTEIAYKDVKKMAFYFFETLSRLANRTFTEEQLEARRAKGQAITLMQAINEVITPDDVMGTDPITKEEIVVGHKPNKYRGSYKCYSQRCFDQGNAGDPHEYTGVQFSFKLPGGVSITIDTKYCNIRAQFGPDKYDLSMGQKLCKELDDLGSALWQDWDDTPDGLIEKIRQCDDEDAWWDDDCLYMKSETSPDPANTEKAVSFESQFVKDARGGVKYTDREEDYFSYHYASRDMYYQLLNEQNELRRKCREADARREKYKVRAPGKMITWENMTEEQREAARERYRKIAAY